MLALIAGEGDLPVILAEKLLAEKRPFITCELDGFVSGIAGDKRVFRLETLAGFFESLREAGVSEIAMAGAVRRPEIDPDRIDPETMPLIAEASAAMAGGDDHAIRAFCDLFERQGFRVVGIGDLLGDLIAGAGQIGRTLPDAGAGRDVGLAERTIAELGVKDQGQACVVRDGAVVAREGAAGTAAMLAEVAASRTGLGGFLYKAAKPGQDMRADIPVIGPDTVEQAHQAGLAGIIIAAGEVMILHQDAVRKAVDEAGMFLWVRGNGA